MDEVTSWAFAWRLERRDGVAVGLTSHDRDLAHGGLTYRASPGMTPAAIATSDDGEPGALEAAGALSAAAIGAADLAAGRWDGAAVSLLAIDWRTGAAHPLAAGELGTIEIRDGAYSAELRGAEAVLQAPASEATSPDCRAALGDRRCRVAMAGRRRTARVTAADAAELTVGADEPVDNGWGFGRLRWLTGANSGLDAAVMRSAGRRLTLREPPAFPPAPGDRVALIEGCDKRLETCRDRFANAVNFRGEPFLPGIDLLTRYPGQ